MPKQLDELMWDIVAVYEDGSEELLFTVPADFFDGEPESGDQE